MRFLTVALPSLLVGLIVGATLLRGGSRLDGRLSACQDITSSINRQIPLQLTCTVAKGDVWISTPLNPGVQVSLDGLSTLK